MFVVAPFFLIALLVWVDRGASAAALRRRGGGRVALLPLTISVRALHRDRGDLGHARAAPIWARLRLAAFDSIDATVLAGGVLAAALFLLVPRRYALALPLGDAPLLRGACRTTSGSASTASSRRPSARSSRGSGSATATGSTTPFRTGATVGDRLDRRPDRFTVNQNEFFNRAVGPIYYVGGPTPGGLAETEVRVDEATARSGPATASARPAVRAPRGRDLARRRRRRPRRGHPASRSGASPARSSRRRPVDGPLSERHLVGPRSPGHASAAAAARSRWALERPAALRRRQVVTASRRRSWAGAGSTHRHGASCGFARSRRTASAASSSALRETKVPGGGDDRELGVHFDTSTTGREDRVRRRPLSHPRTGSATTSRLARRPGRGRRAGSTRSSRSRRRACGAAG